MNATLLLLAALNGTPKTLPIELATAERTGATTARLTMLKAEPRLQAICLDEVGYLPSEILAAREEAAAQTVWLYLGPRRVARGHVTSFEAAPSATGPCAVTAEAQFEDAVPLIAKTDVLWVSGRDFGSRPHLPLPKGVLERARASLPEALAESCKQPSSSTSRGSESGTFVNLVCSAPTGETSTLVLLPSKGPAQILLSDGGDEGRLTLVDVLDPARKSGHALLLSREVDGGRRMELWETEGRELKRVQSWGF